MTERAPREQLEPGGVNARIVLWTAAGSVVFLAASAGLLWAVFSAFVPTDRTPKFETFPQPQLEAYPSKELDALMTGQRQRMLTYRWADKDHTLAAIPIDRAMEIVAARGARAYAPVVSAETSGKPERRP